MKKAFAVTVIGIMLLTGAGCSKGVKVASSQPQQVKQALIQRRTSEPPKPPENVPAPTPVNTIETIQ